MEFTINAYGQSFKFFHLADDAEGKKSALWVNSNGKEGTLGEQCMKPLRGQIGVSTSIEVTEKNARDKARRWLKAQADRFDQTNQGF